MFVLYCTVQYCTRNSSEMEPNFLYLTIQNVQVTPTRQPSCNGHKMTKAPERALCIPPPKPITQPPDALATIAHESDPHLHSASASTPK